MVIKKTYQLFTFFLVVMSNTFVYGHIDYSIQNISPNQQEITVSIKLKPKDFLYKDNIQFSIDHPDIKLSDWHTSTNAVPFYDPAFKQTKKVFNKDFTISLQATRTAIEIGDAHVYFTYHQHSQKKIKQELLPLSFNSEKQTTYVQKTTGNKNPSTHNVNTSAFANQSSPRLHQTGATADRQPHNKKSTSWAGYISDLMQNSDSVWMRLLLVLLLGMLLSLTPCVYPMIPITVGILQSQGSSSIFKNFLMALAYTTGIASTFALLGLSAAFTGQLFGNFMTNPFVVLTIVTLMIYLAGSMLGLYDMYIPRALQSNNASVKGGSYFSAFLFGAASGSVASPCLSPGLVLLLGIVSTLGSKLMGFVLLFSFGIGLGIPLLIIGTFSGSLNMLPRAGMWMMEIKTLFGFIMLAMCFYFLNNIIPWHILIWLISVFTLCTGLFYVYTAQKNDPMWRTIKTILGMLLIAGSVFLFTKSYQASYIHKKEIENSIWLAEYADAINKAKKEGKYIFLDVGAPFCSICKAIDKQLLSKDVVVESLKKFVPVKIDGSDESHEIHTQLRKKFNIMGVPAFIVINPDEETEVKRWGGELYEVNANDFIQELNSYSNHHNTTTTFA